MRDRQQLQNTSNALRLTLEKAQAEYAAIIRRIRWGEGPVFVCAAPECSALGLAAAYAVESLVGWPVLARSPEVFQTYSAALLHPRSVVLVITTSREWPEGEELVRMAHLRACTVVALSPAPEHAVVKSADEAFQVRAEGDADSPGVTICLHAALNFLAFEIARVLKRPSKEWDPLERDIHELPEKIEWVFTQLSEIVRAVSAQIVRCPQLEIVGGGYYHYPAQRAARRLRGSGLPQAEAVDAGQFQLAPAGHPDAAALIVSGSHSKVRKTLHQCAAYARGNGIRVLSLTDGNDRELAQASDLGIFVPPLVEAPSSTLALFMLEWLAMEAARPPRQTLRQT